jgi:hypothetical protein
MIHKTSALNNGPMKMTNVDFITSFVEVFFHGIKIHLLSKMALLFIALNERL